MYEEDYMDKVLKGMIGLLLVVLVFAGSMFIYGLFDMTFLAPERADNAQSICESKGYDVYDTYQMKPFSTKPYGLKCNHISNKYEVEGNGLGVVSMNT